ncbi:MAG: hypothetical protein ABJE47_12535 [bacterium]
MTSSIGVCTASYSVIDAPPGGDIILLRFANPEAMAAATRRGHLQGAIIDVAAWDDTTALQAHKLAALVPIALRIDPTPAARRLLIAPAMRVGQGFYADKRVDSIITLATTLALHSGARGAQIRILNAIPGRVPVSIARILIQAALIAHRRTSVTALARLCDLSPRTIEWRLAQQSLPAAQDLIGLMTSIHAVWQLDLLGWTLKHTANMAGFRSPAALSAYVFRHTGRRPLALRDGGGVDALMGSFESAVGGSAEWRDLPSLSHAP